VVRYDVAMKRAFRNPGRMKAVTASGLGLVVALGCGRTEEPVAASRSAIELPPLTAQVWINDSPWYDTHKDPKLPDGAYAYEPLPTDLPPTDYDSMPVLDPAKSEMELALNEFALLPPTEIVSITIELDESGLAPLPANLVHMSDAVREAIIVDRITESETVQKDLSDWLETKGAVEITPLWIINALQVDLPAASAIAAASWPGVINITRNSGTIVEEQPVNYVREVTGIDDLLADTGLGEPTRRIALIEVEDAITQHHAFWTTAPATRAQNVDCNALRGLTPLRGRKCENVGSGNTANTHATRMSAFAAAAAHPSVSYPGGVHPSAEISVMVIKRKLAAWARAIENSVRRGATIVNMSLGSVALDENDELDPTIPQWGCDRRHDRASLNAIIRRATDLGQLVVKSAGNLALTYGTSQCSLTYPAQHPNVLTVSGINAGAGSFANYSAAGLGAYSSRGGIDIRFAWNRGGSSSGVGIANAGQPPVRIPETPFTPSSLSESFVFIGGSPFDINRFSGTSTATAYTSGGASVIDGLNSQVGWMPTMDARARLVHALATADQTGPNASGDPRTGMDRGFGAGRFLAASPAPGALPTPNGWGNRSLSAIEGVHRWPVGSPGPEGNVAEWKWSVAAFPDDLDAIDASWFIVVVDTCPAGGGFEYVAGDFSTDFRKRIVLKGDDIQGRCLEMRLVVLRAPPTGVPVWMTDFYRGND